MAWRIPDFARWCEGLAQRHRLIHWDQRGNGLSGGDPLAFWDDLGDVEILGVASHFGVERFASLVFGTMAPMALAFAARHPDRVSALVVWEGTVSQARYEEEAAFIAARPLANRDFHQFLQMVVSQWAGDSASHDDRTRIVEMWEASIDREGFTDALGRGVAFDATHELAAIRCPTLVVHRRDLNVWGDSLARELAGGIAGSRLMLLDGESVLPYIGNQEEALQRVLGFLDEVQAESVGPIEKGFRTILFTDVVASTPLLAQLKDAKMREVMRDHDAVLQSAVDEHGGRVVKEIGDAFMAEFAVPSAAVECAIAMQRGIQAQFADTDVPIRLRIGINAGEPVEEDGDLHGASVVIAKRLESAAPVNGILVADGLKQLLAGKDFEFTDQGEVTLKGFDDPVRAWAVGWTE